MKKMFSIRNVPMRTQVIENMQTLVMSHAQHKATRKYPALTLAVPMCTRAIGNTAQPTVSSLLPTQITVRQREQVTEPE